MDEIVRWLQRQSERERRIVYLEQALLSNRFWAYAFYRLRYFFARYCAQSAVHGVTVLLLYRIFSQRSFIAILAVYAGAGLLNSFWWGSLEVMRGRVRTLYRSGRPHVIPREIGRWLSLSIQIALGTIFVTILWSVWQFSYGGGAFDAAHLYVLAILFRLSLEFITRCYHSGIYAIRRIYRPLPAILGVEFVSLAAALALWPWLGSWSFPAGAILSTLTVTGVTIHYTRRSYRFFGFSPAQFLNVKALRSPARGGMGEFFAAGLSYAVMRMDSLLVLALFSTRPRPLENTVLFVLFFLISPTIRAGFEWAQLLYFDLKRLEIKVFRNLRRRFEKSVFQLAFLLGFVFWALASVIGTVVYQRSLGDVYWLLLPFFFSRSLLAVVQIQAFAERAYWELFKNGAFCLVGFLTVGLILDDQRYTVISLAIVTLAGFALLKARREQLEQEVRGREVLWLSEWLAQVRAVQGAVRIAAARFWSGPDRLGRESPRQREEENRWRRRQVGDEIARRLRRLGGVTLIYPDLIAWFERAESPPRVTEEWLLSHGAGLLRPTGDSGVWADGVAALDAASRQNLLGPDLHREANRRDGLVRAVDVKTAFRQMFPRGDVYVPDEPIPAALDALSSKDKRVVMFDAAVFARDFFPSRPRSRFEVTAFCEAGELRLIFVVDRRTDGRLRARWRSLIKQLNLQAALSSVADGDASALRPSGLPISRALIEVEGEPSSSPSRVRSRAES